MPPKLQINLLSCGHRAYRFPFTIRSVQELMTIRNREKVRLCIHGEKQIIDLWKDYFSRTPVSFQVKLYEYGNSNYLDRIANAHKTECQYSCKLDDDVLVSRYVWDYMIDNLSAITWANPIMSPILTNGMPSVELFVQDFLDENERRTAHEMFLRQRIPVDLWGLDYSEINRKINSMDKWDGREYWDFVIKSDTKWDVNPVPWHYFNVRGVHPSRFSFAYNMYIAEKVKEKKDKFFGKNDYRLDLYDAPYFTNNTFISETSYWRDTLPLFDDGWDEGQLSLRMRMDNTSILYVRNGFGIHMAYGMTDNWRTIEDTYIRNISQ